jgi:hypothetical protein
VQDSTNEALYCLFWVIHSISSSKSISIVARNCLTIKSFQLHLSFRNSIISWNSKIWNPDCYEEILAENLSNGTMVMHGATECGRKIHHCTWVWNCGSTESFALLNWYIFLVLLYSRRTFPWPSYARTLNYGSDWLASNFCLTKIMANQNLGLPRLGQKT